jgi:hypothetical protein
LVSFTDSAVTNSIAGSSITYLTFPSFPSGFEAYNSNKGVRTQAGYTEAWTGILANETLAVGQRMVVKTDGIDKFSSFSVSDNTTTGSSWSANYGARQTDDADGKDRNGKLRLQHTMRQSTTIISIAFYTNRRWQE